KLVAIGQDQARQAALDAYREKLARTQILANAGDDIKIGSAATRPLTDQEISLVTHAALTTPPDAAWFWSGRTPDPTSATGFANAADKAPDLAKMNDGYTLEMWLKKNGLPIPATDDEWTLASRLFALGASGQVRVVLGSSLRPGNVW